MAKALKLNGIITIKNIIVAVWFLELKPVATVAIG